MEGVFNPTIYGSAEDGPHPSPLPVGEGTLLITLSDRPLANLTRFAAVAQVEQIHRMHDADRQFALPHLALDLQ